mmetsp:Transcript_94430/g.147578  ORF Transcript_94430/g.147578 Transcript_94430/m.147578 type:complete len:549 (+) Transcript_94430:2-1648(+)
MSDLDDFLDNADDSEKAELRQRVDTLEVENSLLQESLEAANRHADGMASNLASLKIELSIAQKNLADAETEKSWLQVANQEMHAQLESLRDSRDFRVPRAPQSLTVGRHGHGAATPITTTAHAISAVVRLKPPSTNDLPVWTVREEDPKNVIDCRTGQSCTFDHVFGPECSTGELFKICAEEQVKSFCEGISATIMAYGQTGSGKSFTMEGDTLNLGIVHLAAEATFKHLLQPSNSDVSYELRASYVEIHNERVLDLLSEKGLVEVRILETSSGEVLTRPALTKHTIRQPSDITKLLKSGSCHRHIGATNMNDRSSRSHAILQLELESRKQSDTFMRRSLLNLVDLAGSECAKYAGTSGDRLHEGRNINRSLLALSQVVASFADSSSDCPRPSFRDSKLTRIIQQSIGGNSRTLLVCNMSSSDVHYHESKSTLEFACRARKIKNQVRTNLVRLPTSRPDSASTNGYTADAQKLRIQNEQLQREVAQLNAQLRARSPVESVPQSEDAVCKEQQRRRSLADITNTHMSEAARSTHKCHQRRRSGSGQIIY